MDASTQSATLESFVQSMSEHMSTLARNLGTWMLSEPRTLQEQEQQLLRQLHELGSALLSGLLALVPQPTARTLTCPCGAQASFRRLRGATISTLLGRISYTRATYGCASCQQGYAPLDQQLQVAAGSLSLGLQELLALLGATQASFAHGASVLERLSLVQVCPNSVRSATEDLGEQLVEHTQALATALQERGELPLPQRAGPRRLYLSMDGVMVHCRTSGWREMKTGCVYTTRAHQARRAPHERVLRMEQPSYAASLAQAEPFGAQLYLEAGRRGVPQADEVIVIGDGAHWIWNLAELHFPQATQIVDWYHACEYVWNAATSLYGEGSAERASWARQQVDALWEGRLDDVLAALEAGAGDKGALDAAQSYYRSQRSRMDYPSYRARGLQIGSGTIESTCKHLISARLKQAGMIWSERGADAVSAVRAWLKSGRWVEAMALRPVPRRGSKPPSRPRAAEARPLREHEESVGAPAVRAQVLSAEVCERVRAELAAEQARHPWRCAWSRKQQRRQAEVSVDDVQTPAVA